MNALAAGYFATHSDLRFAYLCTERNRYLVDRSPFGVATELLAAEHSRDWLDEYLALNRAAFPGLPLPAWALTDLYVLPAGIGLLLGDVIRSTPEAAAGRSGRGILAAYVAVPSLEPGTFIGVSLLSVAPGIGAGAWAKTLTLRTLGARRVRGVTQWSSASIRTHCRLGELRLVGSVPGPHESADDSFVYEIDLSDEERWRDAMAGQLARPANQRVSPDDLAKRGALLRAAERGERVSIVPPGVDESGQLILRAE